MRAGFNVEMSEIGQSRRVRDPAVTRKAKYRKGASSMGAVVLLVEVRQKPQQTVLPVEPPMRAAPAELSGRARVAVTRRRPTPEPMPRLTKEQRNALRDEATNS